MLYFRGSVERQEHQLVGVQQEAAVQRVRALLARAERGSRAGSRDDGQRDVLRW